MNTKKKKISTGKIIGGIICVVVVGAFLYSTFYSNAFTMDDAIAVAKSYAPKNTVMIGTEEDRKSYDITFANEDRSRKYEFEVNKARHGISQIELSTANDQGSDVVNLSSEQAKEIIEKRFNHLKNIEVFLSRDDGLNVYQVAFKSSKFYGEAEINPETGYILDMTVEYLKKATPSDGDFDFEKAFVNDINPADKNTQNSASASDKKPGKDTDAKKELTVEDARDLISDKLPGANVLEIEYEIEPGHHVHVYEGEAMKDGYEYDFKIDAKTGEFIQWHKELAD